MAEAGARDVQKGEAAEQGTTTKAEAFGLSEETNAVENTIPRYYVYHDESGEPGKGRYFLVGALIVPGEHRQALLQTISDIRERHGFNEEMHFKIVSSRRAPVYREVITSVFRHPVQFCCMIVRNELMNLSYFGNQRYLSYNRFTSLLLQHNLGRCRGWVYIYSDAKSRIRADNFLEYLKRELNWQAYNKNQAYRVRAVECCDSKSDELIQVTDVLLGAIHARITHPDSERKRLLGAWMQAMCTLNRRQIDIWPWKPKEKGT